MPSGLDRTRRLCVTVIAARPIGHAAGAPADGWLGAAVGVIGSVGVIEGLDVGGASDWVADRLSDGDGIELADSIGVLDADAASPECRRSPTTNASQRPAPTPAITTAPVSTPRCHEPAIADHTDVRQFMWSVSLPARVNVPASYGSATTAELRPAAHARQRHQRLCRSLRRQGVRRSTPCPSCELPGRSAER